MFKIVICEDNEKVLNRIVAYIERILQTNGIEGSIVCTARDPAEILEYINNNAADIYFLDIDLKGNENGLNIAEKIRKIDNQAYVVFLTGHFEFALQAFKVKAFDFLVKPVIDEVLENCILRIHNDYLLSNSSGNTEKYLEVKADNCIRRIKIKDIVLVEKIGFKIVIYMTNGNISYYDSLERFGLAINDDRFIRCHKSFIINRAYVSEINFREKTVKFETGQECPIGDRYKDLLYLQKSQSVG